MFPQVILKDTDLVISSGEDALLAGLGIDGRILHTPGHTDVEVYEVGG